MARNRKDKKRSKQDGARDQVGGLREKLQAAVLWPLLLLDFSGAGVDVEVSPPEITVTIIALAENLSL